MMAELESLGYLTKPHVSAGRVPTEAGYRKYVDSLMPAGHVTEQELAKIREVLASGLPLQEVLEGICRLLETLSHQVSMLMIPEARRFGPGIYVFGRANLIAQTGDLAQARSLLSMLESKQELMDLLMPDGGPPGMCIAIGSQNGGCPVGRVSLIRCTYRIGSSWGAIGLLGPLRMDYAKLVALIEVTCREITHFLSEGGWQYGETQRPERT
jgi:transcriptional regulator of heat shock response